MGYKSQAVRVEVSLRPMSGCQQADETVSGTVLKTWRETTRQGQRQTCVATEAMSSVVCSCCIVVPDPHLVHTDFTRDLVSCSVPPSVLGGTNPSWFLEFPGEQ
jgi:hypothetical protein